MQITFYNLFDILDNVDYNTVYKASMAGVEDTIFVEDAYEDVMGLVSGSTFLSLSMEDRVRNLSNPSVGYFTTKEEAIAFHRQMVLNYIEQLNASSLKTCPIVV